jgi:hypothetical protein
MGNAVQVTVGIALGCLFGTMANFFGIPVRSDAARMADYPESQQELGFSSKSHFWISDGAVGSVSHIALAPHQSELTASFCGAAVAAREITRSVIPRHACPQCLQIYTEQAKRD